MTHPENLSGIWLGPDGRGGTVGLVLTLFTNAPASAKTLKGVPQTWVALEAAIYLSPGAELTFADGNSFSDSPRGGLLRYDHDRLQDHWGAFDLNLVHTSRDEWTGTIRRPGFNGALLLRRPGAGVRQKTWLEGAWMSSDGLLPSCLHIAAQASGRYLAWSDNLQTWGSLRFGPHVERPALAPETYGDLIDVEAAGPTHATVTVGAHSGNCCSHTFVISRAQNRTFVRVDSPSPLGVSRPMTTWTRMPTNACISPP